MRKTQFQTAEYYHIYNRGVDKREIFSDEKDFVRFLVSMREFNRIEAVGSLYELDYKKRGGKGVKPPIGGLTPSRAVAFDKLVEIICYSLIPNHYHFLLKQSVEGGVSEFMKRLGTGYTCYFNGKYKRSGSLFQGTYKSIHVKNYSHLLKLMVYVNCNYEIHGLGKAENWIWSSFPDAVGKRNGTLCNFDIIREEFKTPNDFKNFCAEIIPEIKMNKKLSKYLLE